ncbi:cytochrome P450 26B1-like isoform X2 [Babylonia areolata]
MRDMACPLPLPPGTMGYPLVGETFEFVRKGADFFARRLAAHGPVYKTHMIGSPVVRVVGGEHVRHVLMGEHVSVRSSWPQCVQRLVGPRSLLGMSSDEHRKVKPLIGAIFTPAVMASFVPRIQMVVSRHLDRWCQTSAAEGEVSGFPACQRLSLDLSLEIILGQSMERSNDDSLPAAMRQFVGNLFSLPVAIPGCGMWKGLRARERIVQEVRHKLDTTQERSDADFYSIVELMQLHPDMCHQRALIEDNSLELFFAGYSTTSSAFCNALMCMGRNPEAVRKVERELEEEGLLQDPCKELTYDVIERLRYVHACNSEVLRFYPPAGAVFRKANRTLQIGGYQVPKDWVVACSLRETQQTSQAFRDPHLFLPERWLGLTPEEKERSRYEYLPFGTGARVCVGRRLAILMQAVFLVQLLRRCRFRLKEPGAPMVYIPVAKAKDNLPLVVRPRIPAQAEETLAEETG